MGIVYTSPAWPQPGPPPEGPPVDEGGGGGDDGGMLERIAKLEAAVEHIALDVTELKQEARGIRADMRTDFRLHFGALIFVALGLAALMARGFHWL